MGNIGVYTLPLHIKKIKLMHLSGKRKLVTKREDCVKHKLVTGKLPLNIKSYSQVQQVESALPDLNPSCMCIQLMLSKDKGVFKQSRTPY
jgi:hypothetical protein